MRHVLKPALRRLWRGPSTVQIGLDPDRAVVLAGSDDDVAELLARLDGGETLTDIGDHDAMVSPGRRLLDLLREAGMVDDVHASSAPLPGLSHTARDRLAPDLAALSLATGAHDGGVGLLRRRRQSGITVYGGSRVGATVATLLAAAGVGSVNVVDPGRCTSADCVPGGLRPSQLGRSREAAIGELLDSYATASQQTDVPPVAVVLTGPAATDPRVRDRLVEQRVPHLVATVRETTGLVGAFVLPGRSACLRCLDLHRADRDPAWPVLAAQLATPPRATVEACDSVLATAVACWAAREILGFLDGCTRPATVNGSLELSAADWRWRRRSWSPHPSCACTQAAEDAE